MEKNEKKVDKHPTTSLFTSNSKKCCITRKPRSCIFDKRLN